MVIYHSWVQELYRGKEVQDFDPQVVSRTLASIWLQGVQTAKKTAPARQNVLARSNRRKHQVKVTR
jgi:hypothetical protein